MAGRIIVIILWISCRAWDIQAQQRPVWHEVLLSAEQDTQVMLYQRQLDIFKQVDFSLPVVKKLEFRTTNTGLDKTRQDYALRVSTNGVGSILSHREVLKSMQQVKLTRRQVLLNNALDDRYRDLLVHAFQDRRMALYNAYESLLQRKSKAMLQLYAQGLEDDFDDVIDSEEDLLDLQKKKWEWEHRTANNSRDLLGYISAAQLELLDLSGLIPLQQMAALIEEMRADSLNYVPELMVMEQEAELARKEWTQKRRESWNVLDFFQVRYRNRDPEDILRERIQLSAGFNIPVTGHQKAEWQKDKVDAMEAAQELAAEKAKLGAQIWELQCNWLSRYAIRNKLEKQLGEYRERFNVQRLKESGLQDAVAILKIEAADMRQQSALMDLDFTLYEEYLELMYLSGMLSARPWRNMLSQTLETME
jgi:hypothetical protein